MSESMDLSIGVSVDQDWAQDVPTALAQVPRQQPKQQQQVSACDQCHRRKLRCSREKPACGRCHFSGRQCTYSLSRPAGRPRRSLSGKPESSAGELLPGRLNDKMAEAISFADTAVPLMREYPLPGSLFDINSFPSTMSAVPFPDTYHDTFSGTTTLCTSPTVISPGSGVTGHSALSRPLPSLPGHPELAFLADGGRPEPAGRAASPPTSASAGSEGAVCHCAEALLRSALDLESAAAAATDPSPRPWVLELANTGFEAVVMCKQRHDGLQHLMLLVVICQLERYTGIACPPLPLPPPPPSPLPQHQQQQKNNGGVAAAAVASPGSRGSSLPLSPRGLVSPPPPPPAGFGEHQDPPPDAKASSSQPDELASFSKGPVLRSYLLLAALSSEVLTREGSQSCFPEVPLDVTRGRVDWMKAAFRARLGLDV
ncbi:hypothetical protein GGTG_05514 [Gaeumannomyces tritici R3-111a-1]|uniref:Zn(2)-C6 fungal-type domain-containing protein n=1 Tax=Gaeumannomyces tritici (strain R3-111a-1) TaxID=644352 RepID=J3NW49_GAET3|nr:hypothetical protein GGTG_05514 [Gaeumannomyces tritici R3-111a-1]EJT75581.1 hypothetical protein GGTG_05514 [Gaeumannomyces tritici R3-111a-1]